ncbi:hypothetical protein DI392_03885 [Vibrio albus]|uniref:Uncharacterized protein n=1 Tax=Vibrio albus TaxID=2200953 RepID=A0A2U3BBT7_9VIBR|nr:hypothetical protein DI392_03885 [Vibrio albus]
MLISIAPVQAVNCVMSLFSQFDDFTQNNQHALITDKKKPLSLKERGSVACIVGIILQIVGLIADLQVLYLIDKQSECQDILSLFYNEITCILDHDRLKSAHIGCSFSCARCKLY